MKAQRSTTRAPAASLGSFEDEPGKGRERGPSEKPGKKPSKGDRRKEQIMTAAVTLFARKGYHETTVADILREIGAARGTFYRYFQDKHDLFNQLLETNFRYLKSVLLSIPRDRPLSSDDFESILRELFIKMFSRPYSWEFMVMMVDQAAGADPYFAAKLNGFYDGIAEVFSQYLTRLQQSGMVEKGDALAQAYFILGGVREIFVQWARGKKFRDLESLVHETITFMVHGLRPTEKARKARRKKLQTPSSK